MQMTRGARYSTVLHGGLLVLMLFGLPSFMHRHVDPEPMAISVDILPISQMSNVKPQEKTPEKIEEKKPKAQEKTERKAATEAKKEEKKAEEPLPVPVPTKEVIKKVEKKKPEKKVEKKSDDLASILKSVKDQAKATESKKPTEKAAEPDQKQAVSQNYNDAMPLSMSEKDAIRNQFQKCWDVPAGAKDAYNLIVTLHIEVTEDGTVTKVELASDESRYSSDSFFRAAADSAIRAVQRCSPLKELPADKYGSWRDMELTFDPKDMLY